MTGSAGHGRDDLANGWMPRTEYLAWFAVISSFAPLLMAAAIGLLDLLQHVHL